MLSVTVLCGIAGIPAIILGHLGLSKIKKSNGQLKGEGLALAGLIMGYFSLVLTLLFVAAIAVPNLTRSRQQANEAAAAATVRTLNTSQVTHSPLYPDPYTPPNPSPT